MPTFIEAHGGHLVWAARALAVSLLALVGSWIHGLGGVAPGPEDLPDGSVSTDRLFNWHPICMALGFGVIMTEAVLAYRAPARPSFTRESRKIEHWSLHSAAVLCISFGLLAVWRSHDLKDPPIPNLYSPHSFLGLSVVALLGAQFLVGAGCYLWPKASLERRVALGPYHRFLGLSAYIGGLAALATGLQEKASFLQAFGKKDVYGWHVRYPAAAEVLVLLLALAVAAQFALGGAKRPAYTPVHVSDHDEEDGGGDDRPSSGIHATS